MHRCCRCRRRSHYRCCRCRSCLPAFATGALAPENERINNSGAVIFASTGHDITQRRRMHLVRDQLWSTKKTKVQLDFSTERKATPPPQNILTIYQVCEQKNKSNRAKDKSTKIKNNTRCTDIAQTLSTSTRITVQSQIALSRGGWQWDISWRLSGVVRAQHFGRRSLFLSFLVAWRMAKNEAYAHVCFVRQLNAVTEATWLPQQHQRKLHRRTAAVARLA